MYCIHPIPARVSSSFTELYITDKRRMKRHSGTINRDSDQYSQSHYRAHWQPLWAILGLVLCTLLVITQGWAAVYDLCAKSKGVPKRDSIADLVEAYVGVSDSILTDKSLELVTANDLSSRYSSSSCISRIKSYIGLRLGRMSPSETDGFQMTCLTSRIITNRAGKEKGGSRGF